MLHLFYDIPSIPPTPPQSTQPASRPFQLLISAYRGGELQRSVYCVEFYGIRYTKCNRHDFHHEAREGSRGFSWKNSAGKVFL